MIKCKCVKCGEEDTYSDHKAAWMAGWSFTGQKQYCSECPEVPVVSPINAQLKELLTITANE